MRILISALITLALAMAALPASAQTAKRLKQFNDWATYTYQQSGASPICYVMSVPSTLEPSNLDHGNIFFSVSQRPDANVTYEPQFIASYNMQEKSKVSVKIGDREFTMFTRDNLAWLQNPAEAPDFVAAMRAGARMEVSAVSRRGNNTRYSFSLKGITAALESIRTCR